MLLWSFEVEAAHAADFERVYGAAGDWARLFARSPDYLGTELLKDTLRPCRYLTVDRWRSAAAFAAFKEQWRAEYDALDARCESLTKTETPLGAFEA